MKGGGQGGRRVRGQFPPNFLLPLPPAQEQEQEHQAEQENQTAGGNEELLQEGDVFGHLPHHGLHLPLPGLHQMEELPEGGVSRGHGGVLLLLLVALDPVVLPLLLLIVGL